MTNRALLTPLLTPFLPPSLSSILPWAIAAASLAGLLVAAWRGRRTGRLFREVADAIPGGLVMWDAQDRLMMWNQAFADIYNLCAPALKRGVTFEALIRFGVSQGQYPQAVGREEEFVGQLVEAHRRGSQTAERQLPNGRWILINEQRTASGNLVAIRSDITAMKTALAKVAEAHDVAHHMAHHDALTGLPNRVLFHERVEAALRDLGAGGPGFSVLCLDLDRFKAVNDELGHAGGDELLGAVAGRLLDAVGAGGTVARLGGDEFAVLAFGSAAAAGELAARVIARVGVPYRLMTGRAEIGVSVGAAEAEAGLSRDDVMRGADAALYDAKDAGRGTFRAAAAGAGAARFGAAARAKSSGGPEARRPTRFCESCADASLSAYPA